MIKTSKGRVIAAWWGALENGGETIGDLEALCRFVRLAKGYFSNVTVASYYGYQEFESLCCPVESLDDLAPSKFDLLFFVCGPVIKGSSSFVKMIDRFSSVRKFGIAVSILPASSPDAWDPFEQTLARDGKNDAIGDFAFSPEPRVLRVSSGPVGVCLRGRQREYGPNTSLDIEERDIIPLCRGTSSNPLMPLDTRLRGQYGSALRIRSEFSGCQAIITTRLHGLLLGLSLNIPVIAIDQIRGGAKVASISKVLEWPITVRADDYTSNNDFKRLELLTDHLQAKDQLASYLDHSRKLMQMSLTRAEQRVFQLFERLI